MEEDFYVIGPGGDPGESGIWRRGPRPALDKMVISSYGLYKMGYDIHSVAVWSDEAIKRLVMDIDERAYERAEHE